MKLHDLQSLLAPFTSRNGLAGVRDQVMARHRPEVTKDRRPVQAAE